MHVHHSGNADGRNLNAKSRAEICLGYGGSKTIRKTGVSGWLVCGDHRWEIIRAYLDALENLRDGVGVNEDLPYPKEVIGAAILREIAENPNGDFRSPLEIAFAQLELFIPRRERAILAKFKAVAMLSQRLAEKGDIVSILNSAKMLGREFGDRAVEIQERISKKMRRRLSGVSVFGKARELQSRAQRSRSPEKAANALHHEGRPF